MKGSVNYKEHDSDTNYSPKYEMNFTYLFEINQPNVDGVIEIESGDTYFIIPDKIKEDYYHKVLG